MRSGPPLRRRRMPARPGNAAGSSSVKACVDPESNHTSRMSVTCSQSAGVATRPSRKRCCAPASNHASAPLARHRLANARHKFLRLGECWRRDHFACLPMPEDSDRHAPGALARDDPVGLGVDHAAQAVAAGSRHKLGLSDGLLGKLAQTAVGAGSPRPSAARRAGAERAFDGCPRPGDGAREPQRLIHGDEPLRRIAEDDRLLGAPGVRVLMLQATTRDQRVGPDQRIDDRLVGVALVALVVDDTFAFEARRILGEAPLAVDGEGDGGVDAATCSAPVHWPSRCRSPRGHDREPCARSPCPPHP